jgi:hypothetical protein
MKKWLIIPALAAGCGDETYSDRGTKLDQEAFEDHARNSADAMAAQRPDSDGSAEFESDDAKLPSQDEVLVKDVPPNPQASPTLAPDSSTVLDPAAEGDANIVVFRIKSGTGTKIWNTKAEMLLLKRGQTLRLVNDDTVNHRLHTNGAPCDHGTAFAPGEQFDCQLDDNFDPGARSPLYDHIAGVRAEFWIKVVP